jgi:hypothetical protein
VNLSSYVEGVPNAGNHRLRMHNYSDVNLFIDGGWRNAFSRLKSLVVSGDR